MNNERSVIKILLGVLLLLIIGTTSTYAQTKKVTGSVKDNYGEPIIGANVMVKGTSIGAATDFDGNYSLDAPVGAKLLQVSYIGMKDVEVPITGSVVNIIMEEDVASLDELVVIGYGSVKRRDLTGAVASVRGDQIASNPVSNVAESLQGRLAGVNVISQDGRPGATVSIRVRGGGSITQSNEPLFIVDGFPVSSISDISASEIESIDVLKDASSTAIYGARGANGVIIVTTKSGTDGRIKILYDGYIQNKSVSKVLKTLTAQEYVLHTWSYAASRGSANQDAVEKYFGLGSKYGNHFSEYADMKAHNYTHDVLRNAWMQSHQISISGGNEKTKINSNIGFIQDEGIKINSDFNRMNASFKLQQELAKNLHLDMDLRYTESNSNGRENVVNGRGSEVSGAYTYRPIDNPLGGVHYSEVASGFSFGVANIDDKHNPVELINDITDKGYTQSLRGTAALTWEIINGLSARSELSLTRGTSKNSYYENGYTNGEKRATLSRGLNKGVRSATTINYNFNLGPSNSLSLLLGNEVSSFESEGSQISGRGFPDMFDYKTTMGMIHTATNSISSHNTIGVPSNIVSFFGRLNYSLLDKYLLTTTLRADGSSKFAENNRWGYFPAVAFAWRLNEEPFMNQADDWLSNLKLRLSYGASGADNISSNLWRETWSSLGSGSNHTPINGEFGAFYRPDGLLANPDLKWETTVSRNIGIDYGLFNNRINGSAELYWNTTKDLLMAIPIDNTTGYSYQFQNFGQTSNRGIELSLNADIINRNNFRFNVGVIYNYNLNNLDKLHNAEQYLYSSYWGSSALVPTNDYMFEEGKPIGLVRGFISDGYYSVDDFNFVNNEYVLKDNIPDISKALTATYMHPFNIPSGQTAFPGAAKFIDVDESGTVDLDDATNIGSVIPKHTGGFQFNFSYKLFDVSSNFTWVAGGKIYNVAAMINASGHEFHGIGEQRASWVTEAFKVYDVDQSGNLYPVTNPEELKLLNADAKYHLPFHQSGITASEWLEDASYLRLQNLTVGCNIPKKVLSKLSIEKLRVYATANNLFVITGYSGVDPEVNATPTGQSGFYSNLRIFPTPNMDFGAYPRSRSFTLGVNIEF